MKSKTNKNRLLSAFIAVAILLNISLTGCSNDNTGSDAVTDNLPNITGYPIVSTNQTKFYDNTTEISAPTTGSAFYGQNAMYSGNASNYVKNGDGTVTDMVTGLMWQQTEDITGDGAINFYDKLTYSEALAGAATCKTGGHTDWRLPTIKELYSLGMFYGNEPGPGESTCVKYINENYFSVGYGDVNALSHGGLANERVIDGQIATSTKYVSTTYGQLEAMFAFNFIDGRIKGYPTTYIVPEDGQTKHFYVLYVRGNTSYGTNQFVNNGNGTISDNATGLMWMQNDNGTGLTWENALSYAENLTFSGYSDWRLPNTKELQSIVDYTRSPATTNSAAINPLFSCTQITNEGGAADYPWYWSNTTFSTGTPTNGTSAIYVCFGRAMGYYSGLGWTDVHGAGSQRSDPKINNFTGYTQNGNGYYNANAPQGDAVRILNYVRLVRNIK